MLTDGLSLLGSSVAENLTIANGAALPSSGNIVGRLFYLTSGTPGLNVYTPTGWAAVSSGGSGSLAASSLTGTTLAANVTSAALTTLTSGVLNFTAATNYINFGAGSGVAPPALNARSVGTKIVLFSNLAPGTTDFAIGMDAATLWTAVSNTTQQFKWYGGTTTAMTLSGTGSLTLPNALSFSGSTAATNTIGYSSSALIVKPNATNAFGTLYSIPSGTFRTSGLYAISDPNQSNGPYIGFHVGAGTATASSPPTYGGFQSLAVTSGNATTTGSLPFIFTIGAFNPLTLDVNGNAIFGPSGAPLTHAAVATTATNGFPYIPTMAGVPTGTPTAYTGRAPIVVDSTNNELYWYSTGAWRKGGGAALGTANTFTKGQAVTPVTLVSGASIATDASLSNNFHLTLGTNGTLANPTNLVAGQTLNYQVTQDGSGSRLLTFGNLFKWAGGIVPTLSGAPGAVDFISAYYNGSVLICSIIKDVK